MLLRGSTAGRRSGLVAPATASMSQAGGAASLLRHVEHSGWSPRSGVIAPTSCGARSFLSPRGGVVAPTKCGKPGSQVYWAPWLRSERRAVCPDGFRSRSARLRCSFCSRARSRGGRRARPRERRCEGGQVDELLEPAERALCLRLVRVVHSSQRRGLVPPSGSSRRWMSPRRGMVAPTLAIRRRSPRSGVIASTIR